MSSQNRTVYGLARHGGNFKLLSSEDLNGFEALKQSLVDEHQPATETESILVHAERENPGFEAHLPLKSPSVVSK